MNNEHTDFNEPSAEEGDGAPRESAPADRPLGYWLRAVDALLTREFAVAFEGAGVTRRDWMLLNALSGGAPLPAFERFARKGKRLSALEERGWTEESGDGTWVLTDEGRAAKERLGTIVDGIRSRVAGAVSPEDFATTLSSLEAIARELGWDESVRMPRGGFGRGRGFGPARGFGRDFGPGAGFGPGFGRGFGPGAGFGPEFGGGFGPSHFGGAHCDPAEHEAHHHGAHHHGSHHRRHHEGGSRGRGERAGRRAERAYERGFDAGFSRGRSGDSADAGADTV